MEIQGGATGRRADREPGADPISLPSRRARPRRAPAASTADVATNHRNTTARGAPTARADGAVAGSGRPDLRIARARQAGAAESWRQRLPRRRRETLNRAASERIRVSQARAWN